MKRVFLALGCAALIFAASTAAKPRTPSFSVPAKAAPVLSPPAVVIDDGSYYAPPGPAYAALLGSGLAYVTVGGLPYEDVTPRYGETVSGAVVEPGGAAREQQVLAVAAGPADAQGWAENRGLESNANGAAVSLYVLATPKGAALRATRISPDGEIGPSIPIATVVDQTYELKTRLTVAADGTAYVAWSEGGALLGAELGPGGTVTARATLATPAGRGQLDPLGFATIEGRQILLFAEDGTVSSVEMSPGLPAAEPATVFPHVTPEVGSGNGAVATSGPWVAVANRAADRIKLARFGADGTVVERRRSAALRYPFGARTLRLSTYLPDAPLAAFTSRSRVRAVLLAEEPQPVHTLARDARRSRRPLLAPVRSGEALVSWVANAEPEQPHGLVAAELSGRDLETSEPVVLDRHSYSGAVAAGGVTGRPVLVWRDSSDRSRFVASRLLPESGP